MKSFKKVQEDRIRYHKNPNKFSVHRSSLLIPILDGQESKISFLNHFLIKRSNNSVSLKVSAYKSNGMLVDSFYEEINEKKVYKYNLSKIFNVHKNLSSFQAEFYSSKNLFIPFPAVIIEHTSKNNKNLIHSYNRVLNDTDENFKINREQNYESSFEAMRTNDTSTGIIFHSGANTIKGIIKIKICNSSKIDTYFQKVNLPPFSTKFISLKKYLKKININYICKIKQPKQDMFFGRLLVGSFSLKNNSFTANHSFYLSNDTKEYFGNDESYRQYPFFHKYQNTLKFYPINSPSIIRIYLSTNDKELFCGNIKSPSQEHLSIDINNFFKNNNIKSDVYKIIARSHKKIPTRVNHQLIIGGIGSNYPSSINVSLKNDNVYKPTGKKSYAWGLIPYEKNYDSHLKILCFNSNDRTTANLSIYGSDGIAYRKKIYINNEKLFEISNSFFKKNNIKTEDTYWYSIESEDQNIQAFTITTNKKSKISSGEHNF